MRVIYAMALAFYVTNGAVADQLRDQIASLVTRLTSCISQEAQKKSLAGVDLETAGYSVIARCSVQLEALRSHSQHYWPGSRLQFTQHWRNEEADYLSFAKKLVAYVRTQPDQSVKQQKRQNQPAPMQLGPIR